MKRILVIGDHLVDEYIYSVVERISPEAPVPIARVLKKEYSAGGAGNVACSLSALGNKVALLAAFPAIDEYAFLLNEYSIDKIELNIIDKNILKTRVISDSHHLIRIDEEPIPVQLNKENIERINKQIIEFNADLVVISDYNKYIINNINYIKIPENIKIIADIKPNNFVVLKNYFKNPIHTILPNEKEVKQSINSTSFTEAAEFWLDQLAEFVAVTRGPKGVAIFNSQLENKYTEIPSIALEVNDVTGCGDTITSVYAHLIARNESEINAIHIANYCAAVTASKIGTHKTTASELEEAQMKFTRSLAKVNTTA